MKNLDTPINFQWLSFIFLAIISSYFTYTLSYELGTTPVEKTALIAGSLAIEVIKMYSLIHANTLLSTKKKYKTPKLLVLYGTYSFVAFYSLLASFGYALSTVDKLVETSTIVSNEDSISVDRQNMNLLDRSIEQVNFNIKLKQDLISALPMDNINRRLSLLNLIKTDVASLEEYSQKKTELQAKISKKQLEAQAQKVTVKKTMYQVIGTTLGITPRWVAFAVLFLFALSIELGIFITSPHNFLYQ
jgi:hypothetical protein